MEYWYDYKLVSLSVVVAVIASQLSLAIAARLKAHKGHVGRWLIGGALAMGIGVWSMHFIGMLAYHLPIPVGYDIPLTLFSLLLAVIASLVALYVIFSSEELGWGNSALSALVMGGGIAGMHYTGIYAMQMSPPIEFDTLLFSGSLLVAYAASFLAIRIAFVYSSSSTFFDFPKGGAALVMGIAIAGMHYMAMGAQIIDPASVCLSAEQGMNVELLAALVIMVVMVILVISGIVINSDLNLSQQEKEFALRMAEENQRSLAEAGKLAADLSRESLRNAEFANKLVDSLGALVVVMHRDGRVIRFNRAAELATGFAREEVLERPIWDKLIPEQHQDEFRLVLHSLDAGISPNHHTSYWQTSSGEMRLIEWASSALLDEDGIVEFIISSGIDITEKHANEEELKIAAVAFNTNEAILVTDAEARILRVNRVFSEITGYEIEEVIGRYPSILRSGRHDSAFYHAMWSQINTHGYWSGEIWNKRKDGEIYPELLRITAVKDESGRVNNYVGSFSDISKLKQTEDQLSYISNYDQATGLPNRQLFTKLLQKEIATAPAKGGRGLLFYLRFVQLGILNKSLGSSVVDQFIQRFIERVRERCVRGSIIGRASGSSFVVLLPRVEAKHSLPLLGSQMAESIIQYASDGELIDGVQVRAGINIGIAAFPQDGHGAQETLQNAFAALDMAKSRDGSNYHFFSDELHQAALDNYRMEVALRSAIHNGELQLYYQPQVDHSGRVCGAEALLRWQHQGEFVSPALFIPLAERSELIHEIGHFVFRQGIGELAWLIEAGVPEGFESIALNMSAKQFQDERFIDKLKDSLIEFAVQPAYVKIELTETALMADPQQAVNTINSLKELGIRIALDDFGTGYSSLSYLHRIPIDQLKVDQSFVRDLTINPVSQAITETIVMMAKSMELDVLAEGVETKEEMMLLDSFGCGRYQGHYFYKAMGMTEFAQLLQQQGEERA